MVRARVRLVLALLALLGVLVGAGAAQAHTSPDSQVTLDIAADAVTLDIIIPASEYAYATGLPDDNRPASLGAARAYLQQRVHLGGGDGTDWRGAVEEVRFGITVGPPDLIARMRFEPPPGTSPRSFTLDWRPVLVETADHFAVVLLRADAGGKIGEEPDLLGALRQGNTTLAIERGQSSAWTRLANSVLLGIWHILGGFDHLAFLLTLLLPAPLLASGGRWRGARPTRAAIKALLLVASGFTIGHSLTLIGVAATGISLPSALVEVLIAITVLVSAIHALRPLYPGGEIAVASGFGLIHGLGFAGFISETSVEITQSLLTLLGFNLGIELVQIALLALAAPVAIRLSKTRLYIPVRVALGLAVCLLSIAWITSRAADL